MFNDILKYTIITQHGTWGKGHTIEEAAKNANVKKSMANPSVASIYVADQSYIIGEVDVTCSGSASVQMRYPESCVTADGSLTGESIEFEREAWDAIALEKNVEIFFRRGTLTQLKPLI